MTLWASILSGILSLFRAIAESIRSAKDIELGELREKERQRESDVAIRDAVDRADPKRVSDHEAFGVLGSDNDLPRTFKGGPVGRSDS